jgi:hypothetical protein
LTEQIDGLGYLYIESRLEGENERISRHNINGAEHLSWSACVLDDADHSFTQKTSANSKPDLLAFSLDDADHSFTQKTSADFKPDLFAFTLPAFSKDLRCARSI